MDISETRVQNKLTYVTRKIVTFHSLKYFATWYKKVPFADNYYMYMPWPHFSLSYMRLFPNKTVASVLISHLTEWTFQVL